ncbi:vacuolar protein sorting-associated protein 26B-like isoform X2 [Henckelia pumila]|uniref:vacuolar protein sorting-associated protein 26B-like isoform X2 n=1 Tax=Henckelia pumila TaxID=405737 RepID=UPI003C6DE830
MTTYSVPLKKENGRTVMVPLFQSRENISGKISIVPVSGKKVEHNGIKVELLGQIGFWKLICRCSAIVIIRSTDA